jgi:predicted outer membrane lipoprotein
MREIGTEVVDRIFMDILLGAGSILVGAGTLMAIGGANRRVFKASNLLSGYIGNGLAAAFGLLNSIWSWYLTHRFSKHDAAVRNTQPSDDISRRLHSRFRRFQWHAFINGTNGLAAGAASMVTATRWWGYVVLIPCIVSLIMCNYFWRKKLGYDRPVLGHVSLARTQLTPPVEDLEYVIAMQRGLSGPDISLPQTIVQAGSYESMLQFIMRIVCSKFMPTRWHTTRRLGIFFSKFLPSSRIKSSSPTIPFSAFLPAKPVNGSYWIMANASSALTESASSPIVSNIC